MVLYCNTESARIRCFWLILTMFYKWIRPGSLEQASRINKKATNTDHNQYIILDKDLNHQAIYNRSCRPNVNIFFACLWTKNSTLTVSVSYVIKREIWVTQSSSPSVVWMMSALTVPAPPSPKCRHILMNHQLIDKIMNNDGLKKMLST